jgi:hypothetical protein
MHTASILFLDRQVVTLPDSATLAQRLRATTRLATNIRRLPLSRRNGCRRCLPQGDASASRYCLHCIVFPPLSSLGQSSSCALPCHTLGPKTRAPGSKQATQIKTFISASFFRTGGFCQLMPSSPWATKYSLSYLSAFSAEIQRTNCLMSSGISQRHTRFEGSGACPGTACILTFGEAVHRLHAICGPPWMHQDTYTSTSTESPNCILVTLSGLKKFFVCGASEDQRICLVDMHTGYSLKPPLGSRPGVHLHRGPNSHDAVLAAAGDESQWSATVYAVNNRSVILLPPLEDMKNNLQQLVNEPMLARTVGGRVEDGVSDGEQVRFGFSIEVGHAMRRENFEWVKVAKGGETDGKEIKAGCYNMIRLPRRSEPGASVSPLNGSGAKVVAIPIFINVWSSLKHTFSLDLRGNGPVLGDRWALIAAMTSLRLLWLRVKGRTTKTMVAARREG